MQDVWISRFINGKWNEAENIGPPINNNDHNAISTISADGKNIYLVNAYLPDGKYKQGLSVSKKTNKGWAFPKEIKINDYYNNAKYTEFSLAPSGKVLVMACKRLETYGEKDLYVSFMKNDGTWSKPINMGANINTVQDEGTPFIASDSKTLYFSTQGLPGYGESDIFVSRRLDSTWTNWSEPENLGDRINTSKWDGYFTIPASGDYAYLSSEEKSTGGEYEDIFRVKLFPSIKPEPVAIIFGTVVNAMDKTPLSADVILEIMGDTTKKSQMNAEFDPQTGEYKFVVPLKKTYMLNASKKGYISISDNIDLSKERSFREIKKNINLIPVQEGQKMILNNLFFEQGLFEIKSESYPELDRIVNLMKEFPTIEVLLEGHTHSTPEDDEKLNLKLSGDRVNEVKKYLVEKGGIEERRIQIKAWGGSRPIASNQTEETRKKNRRVEFTILKL
jgi:outer membrane protein OmpA-like peptidoglycan-associated protein